MKKFMVSAIILLLTLSVVMMAESATQEDMKAVESLVDVMSGKLGDYSDRLGVTERGLDVLGKEVRELEDKVEGLDTNDKLLMNKVGESTVEGTIDVRIDALRKEMEAYNSEFRDLLDRLADKAALETLGSEFTEQISSAMAKINKLTGELELLDGKVKTNETEDAQLESSVTDMQALLNTKNEAMANRVEELEAYAQQLKKEYNEALDALSAGLKAEIATIEQASDTSETYSKIIALEKSIEALQTEMRGMIPGTDLNERLSALEAQLETLKTDVSDNGVDVSTKIFVLETELKNVESSIQSSVETNAKNISELKMVNGTLDSAIDEVKEDMEMNRNETKATAEESRVAILQEVDSKLIETKTSLNMRLKWIDINIKGLKDDIAANALEDEKKYTALEARLDTFTTETERKLGEIDETLRSQSAQGTAGYEEVAASLTEIQEAFDKKLGDSLWSINKRMNWMDIASGKIKADLGDAEEELNAKLILTDSKVETLGSDLKKLTEYDNERFKLTYLSIADLRADIQENLELLDALEQGTTAGIEAVKADLEKSGAYNNDRFKLIYMTLADLSSDISENGKASDGKIETLKQELTDELASKIASLNLRLKWMDISASKLKKTVEEQAKTIEAVSVAMKSELGQEMVLVNQKLMIVDSQIERLDTEKAAQTDVAQLRKEFDVVVDRLNSLAFSLAFEQGMTQKILSEIAAIKEAADLLNTRVAILYAEYATKEMLEAEIAQVNASLSELEELTYTLNEKTEQLVADKVWALNQRLKWVDMTIKRAKDERAELKDYVLDLETRLEEEINSKVAYINMRLKWTDISITKLKETKVEKTEYNETVTRLDTVKVDKETFAREINSIDMRFIALENSMEDFKKETNTLLMAHKEMLEAKIDGNTELIKENKALIENNGSEIEKLEARISELEKEVFPEEKNTSAFGVLVGFGLVVGLGMILASAK
ncbi:MAG TPA: hypothetical protein PLB99_09850 [Thermotogota bacterium]|nr:hypothetical protein [Thermotogota bacterium]